MTASTTNAAPTDLSEKSPRRATRLLPRTSADGGHAAPRQPGTHQHPAGRRRAAHLGCSGSLGAPARRRVGAEGDRGRGRRHPRRRSSRRRRGGRARQGRPEPGRCRVQRHRARRRDHPVRRRIRASGVGRELGRHPELRRHLDLSLRPRVDRDRGVGREPRRYDDGLRAPQRPGRRREGRSREEVIPGSIRFSRDGVDYDLVAFKAGRALQIVFADATSGDSTYSVGRFLFVAPNPDGTITLDFNRAILPPCAFSYAFNCPLPPKQNRFGIRDRGGREERSREGRLTAARVISAR